VPKLKQEIDVHVSAGVARRAWDRFVQWVLVGNYRLVCDEFSCERAAAAGVVTFVENEDRSTHVQITFDYEDQSPNQMDKERMVGARLFQDLLRFKQFAETGAERTATADLDDQARTAREDASRGPARSHDDIVTQAEEAGRSGFVT
jgi:hypothetical protein